MPLSSSATSSSAAGAAHKARTTTAAAAAAAAAAPPSTVTDDDAVRRTVLLSIATCVRRGGMSLAPASAAIKAALKDGHDKHLGYLGSSELDAVTASQPWMDAMLGHLL